MTNITSSVLLNAWTFIRPAVVERFHRTLRAVVHILLYSSTMQEVVLYHARGCLYSISILLALIDNESRSQSWTIGFVQITWPRDGRYITMHLAVVCFDISHNRQLHVPHHPCCCSEDTAEVGWIMFCELFEGRVAMISCRNLTPPFRCQFLVVSLWYQVSTAATAWMETVQLTSPEGYEPVVWSDA